MSDAIIIVGSTAGRSNKSRQRGGPLSRLLMALGLPPFWILGQSVLQRTVAELKKAKVEGISVCVDGTFSSPVEEADADAVRPVMTAWEFVGERLRQLASKGAEPVLIY